MKKPADLQIPFSWEERRPIFLEKFFYIPKAYHGEHTLKLSWKEIFGNDNDVILEYCSGNGQWIAEKAKENPQINWLALDIRFDRCRKTWLKIHRENLPNLYVLCGDARIFTHHYIPKKSLSKIYVNFPDPWPKLRHAKHRLVQFPFVEEMASLLIPGGEGIFVTDDAPHAGQMIEELSKSASWKPLLPPPHYVLNPENFGNSFFSDLWLKKGKSIHYLPYQI